MIQEQKAVSFTQADGLRVGLQEATDQSELVVTHLEQVQAAKEEAMQVGSATLIIISYSSKV